VFQAYNLFPHRSVIENVILGAVKALIATHEMQFAREIADQVCYLQDGLIVERGSPEQILTAPASPETQRFLARLLSARRL
jgi:polar amino acid transport system ATP-binding protein